jgi:pyruvate dehydrogenase E1 component alpha subunit
MKYRRRNQDLAQIVAPYALPVVKVDGNDVREVYQAAREAVERARAGDGPTFLHCVTYRWRGHVGPYDNLEVGLRSDDEVRKWLERCPIDLEKKRQMAEGLLDEVTTEAVEKDVAAIVAKAVGFAIESPRPRPENSMSKVFRKA